MNRDLQKTRIAILAFSGVLLAASAGAWVYYNQTRQVEPGPFSAQSPASAPVAGPPLESPLMPVAYGPSTKPSGSQNAVVAAVAPAPAVPAVSARVSGEVPVAPPGSLTPASLPVPTNNPHSVAAVLLPDRSTLPGPESGSVPAALQISKPTGVPASSNITRTLSGGAQAPNGNTQPGGNSASFSTFDGARIPATTPASADATASAAAAERARHALDAYKKRKQGELYAFLFNNAPPPRPESPPSAIVNKSGQSMVPATTRLEAIAAARKSISLSDNPCLNIDQKDLKPFGPREPNSTIDWKLVLMDKNKGPKIPNAPNPTFPKIPPPPDTPLLVPPEPPSAGGGGIEIPQLPLPPERPTANLDDMRLLAVMDDGAIFRIKREHVVLMVGDQYEGLTLTGVTKNGVTLDDGYRRYTKTL